MLTHTSQGKTDTFCLPSPRIAFLDEKNFPAPGVFSPERFLSDGDPRKKAFLESGASSGLEQNPDVYFPGGVGQHKCPGLSLSTLMTQVRVGQAFPNHRRPVSSPSLTSTAVIKRSTTYITNALFYFSAGDCSDRLR